LIARLGESGFGDGDAACPGSGQACPAATVTAFVPSGGTPVPAVGTGAGEGADTDEVVAEGTDVTDGEPLPGFGGISDGGPTAAAELTGAAGVGKLVSGALAGADDDTTDCCAPAWLRWLEQPAAVAASPTMIVVITVTDVVRITLYPPAGFTLSTSHPTFIVNRRHGPRES
jgi:hypothetical protein